MSAPEKNQNALKWTAEKVTVCLNQIQSDIKGDNAFYLNEALTLIGASRKAWSYWKKIHKQDDDIREQMELIETLCEVRLFKGAMEGKLPVTMSIFGLKNNHHWTDKPAMVIEKDDLEDAVTVHMDSDTIVTINPGQKNQVFKRVSADLQNA
jgi:hypothetical protein